MIKVSTVVQQIIEDDVDALVAMRRGMMNFSSYARQIQSRVANGAFKPVDEKSIVVALSRLSKEFIGQDLSPIIKLTSVAIHPDLVDISYDKTTKNLAKLQEFYRGATIPADKFFTATQSISEITVIADSGFTDKLQEVLGNNHIFYRGNLTGITTKFSVDYLSVPNVMFEISKVLAAKNINIIEIVSTTTELTFIIAREEATMALTQLQKFL